MAVKIYLIVVERTNSLQLQTNNFTRPVDVVFTAGQTIHEYAQVLRKAGAKMAEGPGTDDII